MRFARLARMGLLVLLAALLPIRGAVAAAWLCPPAAGELSHAHAAPADAQHHHTDEMPAGHHSAGDEQGSPQQHHDEGLQDKCSHCASCCSAVPLASAFPMVPEPFDAAQSFPTPLSPVPSFVPGGPERPPRSI